MVYKLSYFIINYMLFKVVLDKQIRVFDCRQAPSITLINAFITKTFPQLKAYTVYYLDQDKDHIVLETDSDLNIFLSNGNSKPKIFINTIKQEAFETTVKIDIDTKEQEKQQIKAPEKIEEKEIVEKKEQEPKPIIKEEEVLAKIIKEQEGQQKIEKINQQVHLVKCDGCGQSPIISIRFNCSVCQSFDFCQNCESLQKHEHPLIKIRFSQQAPISCKIEFNQARASLIAQKLKTSQLKKKQKIVYQSNTERQQIVISYLGNLLGEDQFLKYKQFSKVCKCENYDDIVQEYLSWTQNNETSFEKITNWILKYIAKIKEQF